MVQLGGLEPPTSCSTDRRSNQLSYNCILYRPQKKGRRTGRKLGATPRFGKAGGDTLGAVRARSKRGLKSKKPRLTPGLFSGIEIDQAAGLNSFDALVLIGSTVSVATFWVNSASSLAWAVNVSNCLRA